MGQRKNIYIAHSSFEDERDKTILSFMLLHKQYEVRNNPKVSVSPSGISESSVTLLYGFNSYDLFPFVSAYVPGINILRLKNK